MQKSRLQQIGQAMDRVFQELCTSEAVGHNSKLCSAEMTSLCTMHNNSCFLRLMAGSSEEGNKLHCFHVSTEEEKSHSLYSAMLPSIPGYAAAMG